MDKYYIAEVSKNIETGIKDPTTRILDHIVGPDLYDQSELFNYLKQNKSKIDVIHFYGSQEEYEFFEGLLLIVGITIPLEHKVEPPNFKYPINTLGSLFYKVAVIFPERLLRT